jgi:hypothetical protein
MTITYTNHRVIYPTTDNIDKYENKDHQVYLVTEVCKDFDKGIYIRSVHYLDGTVETEEFTKSKK